MPKYSVTHIQGKKEITNTCKLNHLGKNSIATHCIVIVQRTLLTYTAYMLIINFKSAYQKHGIWKTNCSSKVENIVPCRA